MSSSLPSREPREQRQAAKGKVQIRESALLPVSADQIAAMANQRQAESNSTQGIEQTAGKQSSCLDFGNFKTGTPQYSHAHWNAANAGQAATVATPHVVDQLAINPASLRPDVDSLRAEVCSNASSTSLSSRSVKTVVSVGVSSRDSKPASPTPASADADSKSPSPTNATSSHPDDAGADITMTPPSSINTPSNDEAESLAEDVITSAVAKIEIHDFADNKSDSSAMTVTQPTKSKTGEQCNSTTINRQYPILKKRPAPIITDHPAYGSDPFASASSSPRLSSTWTPTQLRAYNENQNPKQAETKQARNNLLDIVRASSHEEELLSLTEAAKEGPPPPTPTTVRRSSSIRFSRPRTASGNSTSTTPTTKRSFTPFNLRNVASSMLSPRPDTPQFDSAEHREKQERYLRTVTNSLPRSNASMFPAHPTTSRNWMHRNLRCTQCTDATCAKCGKACCAWKAAERGIANHPNKGEARERAVKLKREIELAGSFGRELPTFLKCSDCEKMVCPECCGECSDEICKLICCRKCKSDPWVACDFHQDL